MTGGPDPPWRIYGDPFTPPSPKLVEPWARVRTPKALGGYLLPAVSDELLIAWNADAIAVRLK